MNRRSFLGFLAALPVVGWMFRPAKASEPLRLPCMFVRYVATTEPPYRVEKNILQDILGSVNATEFLGHPPRSVMCSEMRYSEQTPGLWTIKAFFRSCQGDIVCMDGTRHSVHRGVDFNEYEIGEVES